MTTEAVLLFFNSIIARQRFIDDFETLYAKKLAIHFNALDFLPWNENKVSEILAYFLNPSAGHGHGDAYLRLFIKNFGLRFNYTNALSVKVRMEESTDTNRRVDIVLSATNGSDVIGIENKINPWTADQKDQVSHYIHFLKNFYKASNYQLVYIAPKSKVLTEYSAGKELNTLLERGELVIVNYEEGIIRLVGDFIKCTENERVKNFLEDFKRRLTEKYIGMENLDSKTMFAKFINESDQNLRIAFTVANSLNGLKEELKLLLVEQMSEVARDLNVGFDNKHTHFELPGFSKIYVKYSYEEGGVLYGLVKKPDFFHSHPDRMMLPELGRHLGIKFRSSYWWPLYFKQYADIETNETFWMDIRSGRFALFIKDFIKEVMVAPSELIHGL